MKTSTGLGHHLAKSACAPRYQLDLDAAYAAEEQHTDPGPSRRHGPTDDDGDGPMDSDEEMRSSRGSLNDVEMISNPGEHEQYDGDEQEDVEGSNETNLQYRGTETYVQRYPNPHAGAPIRRATAQECQRRNHTDVGRLNDPDVFAVAEFLMTSGLSAKKRDKFLSLNRFNGCTPWKNNRELMKDIDGQLPRGAKWKIHTFEVAGRNGAEVLDLWVRDSLEGVRDLLFDNQFVDDIHYVPLAEWTGPDRKTRKWGETWTARHMWRVQSKIKDKHATVIPYFLASDETVVTVMVGEKKAHPVYLTIGNISKHVRRQISKRAMILVGYLPVTKLECEPNEERRRILKRKLFHQCMSKIIEPLADAGREGVEAVCSDGGIRRIYPVFSGSMLDYPEQCKYAVIKQSACPTCEVPLDERGDWTEYALRDHDDIIKAIKDHEDKGSARFEDLGLIPVRPFWENLPYFDASIMFPPDLLHQLYKGVFKDHLAKWSAKLIGDSKFDNMYKSMSPHHGLRHFKNGVTKVSHWTGREIKEQAKSFLPTVVEQDREVVVAGRAILKFMYLAHSSSLTDDELAEMDEALDTFHQNKVVFKELNAFGLKDIARWDSYQWFNGIPKLHAMLHFTNYIEELGTPDGFNTELPERLHIPYAKQGWRASNKKEATKQMAVFIQRMEAIAMHRAYLDHIKNLQDDARSKAGDGDGEDDEDGEDGEDEGEVLDGGAAADAVGFAAMRRLRIDENGELEFEEEIEWEVEEEVEEDDAYDEPEDVSDDDEEPALERTDVEGIGTWEEIEADDTSAEDRSGSGVMEARSCFYPNPGLTIAKSPTVEPLFTHLTEKYPVDRLFPAIPSFLRKLGHTLTVDDIETAQQLRFKVWHRCRLIHSPPPYKPAEGEKVDSIRALPARQDSYGRERSPSQFDTVLCLVNPLGAGLNRYRAARVRLIFELPSNIHHLFPKKLAYVEFFTNFSGPDKKTGFYQTSHKLTNTRRDVAVIPLAIIKMSCHLAPQFGTATNDLDLATEKDILQSCKKFVFNEFASYFSFELLHHWQVAGACS